MKSINLTKKQILHLQKHRKLSVIGKLWFIKGIEITGRPKDCDDSEFFMFNVVTTSQDGRKTATRMPATPRYEKNEIVCGREEGRRISVFQRERQPDGSITLTEHFGWEYKVDGRTMFEDGYRLPDPSVPLEKVTHDMDWTQARFMPPESSRFILRVKSIRVLLLNDLSEKDAKAAGFDSVEAALKSLLKGGRCSSNNNTWLFIYELELPINAEEFRGA